MSNPGDWLYDQSANRFRGTYTKGFVDISGGNLIVRNGDVSFNNKLFASSDVSFDSTLRIGDTTTLNSLLLVSGDVSMNNKLFVSNDASLNQNLSIGGNITVDNKITVAGDASMNSKLQVADSTILDSTLSVADNATLSAKLAVAGDASMNSKLQVADATILDSTLSVIGDASMNSKLQVADATILDSTLSVTGDATLATKLSVTGDASMNSKLQVADDTTLDSTLSVSGDASMNSKLQVANDTILDSTLSVNGITTLSSTLSVAGDASLSSKLAVAGDASMNSNLQVANATVLDSTLSVTGETTLNNNLSVIGDAFVSSDLSVNNNVLIGGDLSMQGDLTIIGNLSVFQTRDTETIRTTVNEYELIVSEDLSLNGMLKMSGDASLNSNLYVKNDTTVDGNLSVGGDVSMNDKLFVNDNVILKSHIIPETDDTYDLGTATKRFRNMNVKSVVLSSETLHFTGSDSTIAGSLSFDESSNTLDLSANGKNGLSVLQYNDKVAIGTSDNTSPNYSLDVSGNMYISKQGIINGDLSVNDALSVTGITKLDSLLRVIGDASLNSNLLVAGDTSLNSKLFVNDSTTLNNILSVVSDTSLNGKLFVNNDVSFNNSLSVGGDASMNSKLQVTDATILDSTLSVANDASLAAKLAVTGDASMNSKLQVADATILDSTLSVANDASLAAKLAVTGDASMNSKLQVADATILDSTLSVANDASLAAKLAVTGDASMNSKLQVADATILDSTLSVANDATLSAKLAVTGDAFMNSKLQVADATILDSTLSVANDASLAAKLAVTGDASMNSKLQVADATILDSTLSVANDATLNAKLAVTGDASMNSKLQVADATILDSTLSVADDASLAAKLTVTGDASMNSKLFVADDVSLNTELMVGGDVSLNSKLFVTDDVSLNSNLYVGGDLSLNGDLTIQGNLGVFQTTNTKTINTTVNNYEVIVSNDLSINGDVSISGATTMDSTLTVDGNAIVNKINVAENVVSAYDEDSRSFFGRSMVGGIGDDAQWNHIAWSWHSSNWAIRHTRGGILKLNARGGQQMQFMLGAATRMLLNSSGNFGINNNSPTAKLHVGGTFIASGAATLQNTLAVSNATILDSTLSVANDATLAAKLAVTDDASMNSKLQVADATILDSTLSVANDVSMNGKLQVARETILDSTLSVDGNATFNNKLTVGGDASMNSKLQVSNATILDSTLYVSLNSTLTGDVSMNSKLQVDDATILNSTLSVADDTTLSAKLALSGDASMNSKLQVSDATILDGTLSVADDTTLSAKLAVTGDASMNSKLQVTDATTLDSTLSVSDDTNLNAKLYVAGDASMNSKLQVTNSTILDSTLYVEGDTTLNNDLVVANDTSMNGGLFVSNDVSLNSNTFVNQHLAIGTTPFSFNAAALSNSSEQLKFTIPLFMNSLKYFCTAHSSMVEDFTITSSESQDDKIYYVRLNSDPFSAPYYLFSDTENGSALNSSTTKLSLYRGNTYTFIRTDSAGHPFNVGSDYNENKTGMFVSSNGTGTIVSGNVTYKYPLTVDGVMNVKKNLLVERDLSLNRLLSVDGETTLNSTLNVSGISILDSSLIVSGDASLNSKLFVTSDASLNSKLFVVDDVSFNNDLSIGGNANVNNKLLVADDASLNSKLFVVDDVSFNNDLSIGGNANVNNKLLVGGDASFNGDLTVRGNLEVYQQQNTSVINTTVNNYEVIITNDMSLNGNLILDGDASFNSDVYIEGTTNISGDILPIHSNNSNLGSATKPFGSLYISNNTIFFEGSDDNNSGSITFEDGDISILKKGHAANRKRKIKATESSGETKFSGDISGDFHLYLAGDASLNSHLYVSDDVSFDSHLSLGGDASFGGRLDVCGNFYAQYPDNSIPNTSISGGILTVSTIQGETAGTEYSNINTLRFDADSGFDVTDLSNGVVKVGMNSTFKTWKVSGQDDLVASGLDSITFVAGNNMDISTNTTSGGEKQIIFHSSGSGGSSSGGSSSGGSSSTLNNKNQTFFDLLTQQPHQFAFDSSSNTTGNITVSWNFDDLIPNITNHTERALLNLYSSGTNRYLPSISEIRFDLSHSSLGAGWHYYSTFTKAVGNNDYNSGSSYKTLSITKLTDPGGSGISGLLSSTNKFDLRIYGVNNSINYPDEDTRALVVEQLSFKEASPPSDPNYASNTLSGNDQLYLNYSVAQIEAGETSSSAQLDHTQTKYHLNTTLSHYNYDTTIKEDGQENASGTGSFRVELPSLSYGSNFYFLTRISNNLTTLFNISDSDWNSISVNSAPNAYFNTNRDALSVYTNLPGTSGTSTSSSHLPSNGELSYNRKSGNSKNYGGFCVNNTTAINSDQHIYMNKNFSETDAMGESGNPETFEISDTSKTGNNLGSISSGIGKYLNGVTDIVTITASVGGSVKQTIKYHGFNATAGTGTPSPTQSGNANFFDSISQYDPHTHARTKGFRLNGRFHVKDIGNSTVETVIGAPSSSPYNLTLSFSRDSSKTNSGSRSYTTYIYVDNLSGAPTVTAETNTSEVKSVKYCMGIPSVNKFNIILTRTYGNINTTYGYIRGDKKLAYFGGIGNVGGDSNGTQYISSVNSNGSYSITPTYYTSSSGKLYHTTARTGTSNFNVSFNEQVYSLYGTNNRGNINISLNHYYDRNSFANDTTTSAELSISSGDIMEVGSVSNFGSNLFNLTQTSYTDHTTLVQDHTLLYIQGKFQPTSDVTYPTPHDDFAWDNASMSNAGYEAVNKGLDIDGNAVTDGTGYKWIVFRFAKNNNTQVQFNGTNYNLSGGALGLQSILNSYFNSSVVADIFNESNTNAIGFFTIVMTTDSGTNSYLGALQVDQTATTNYISTGTTSRTLDFLVNSTGTTNNGQHGARTGSSGSYTIPLALSSMSGNYFYVYIGLK